MRRLLALVALAGLIGASPPATTLAIPVMYGGEADLDACGSTYEVVGLKPRGDNFLSLRAMPAAMAHELGLLRNGQIVWACDVSTDGAWTGVVFLPPGPRMDCGVGTPVARRRPYRGPCRSGWVSSRFLRIIAG